LKITDLPQVTDERYYRKLLLIQLAIH
jgi:hypothetical protein